MYFWRDKKLAHDLHKGFVSEKQQMLYLLGITILMSLCTFMAYLPADEVQTTVYDYAISLFYLAFSIAYIFTTFKINSKNDNKDYISRFTCLSFPVSVKSSIIGFILMVCGVLIDIFIHFQANVDTYSQTEIDNLIDSAPSGPGLLLGMILTLLYVLWRYTICFKIASGQEEYGK